MNLDEIARRYQVFEKIDRRNFQRQARVLQSMWRVERGYPIGEHRGRGGSRLLGSRLAMPWAEETLSNYLTETVRGVVGQEVLDKTKSSGKLYGRPRIFNDLLSSQPLAFNLFGELQQDLSLATSSLGALSGGRIAEVTGIEFEYSPGRGDDNYTGDNSAFDVYINYITSKGGRGFVGVEVKYHENLLGKPARHRPRYIEVARTMGCFRDDRLKLLQKQPLQQVWRDHLLAGSLLAAADFDDGFFVFLYPERNEFCARAVDDYNACFIEANTFEPWTLESVCASVQRNTRKEWIDVFLDRYLNFGKLTGVPQNET